MLDTAAKLSRQTLFLHWIVALFMIALLSTGVYMEETKAYELYPLHKSFGVLIILFVLWRIYWRLKNGWLVPVAIHKPYEFTLSRIVQWTLILGTLLMPISGMMMSGFGGYGIPLFGLELVSANPDTADPSKMLPYNAILAETGAITHGLASKLIIIAVVLHITGALKHHFVYKDVTLKRMLGKR
jgi:cytochrome b561